MPRRRCSAVKPDQPVVRPYVGVYCNDDVDLDTLRIRAHLQDHLACASETVTPTGWVYKFRAVWAVGAVNAAVTLSAPVSSTTAYRSASLNHQPGESSGLPSRAWVPSGSRPHGWHGDEVVVAKGNGLKGSSVPGGAERLDVAANSGRLGHAVRASRS